MICPGCGKKMHESNRVFQYDEGIYKRKFICLECHTSGECISEGKDMTEEYLEDIGVI